MQNFLENTSDSIWSIDRDYIITYLNNAFKVDFKKAFHTKLSIGKSVFDGLPEEFIRFWKAKYDRALSGQSFSFSQNFEDKKKKKRFIQVSLSPILEKNKVVGVTCLGRDVSKSIENEIALKKSSLLLRACMESQVDTIMLAIDSDYNYLYFNQAHINVMKYAYDKDIKIGMNILDCVTDEEDRKAALDNYSRALKGESHSNIRVYGVENKEYYESFFNPILNEENKIIGATALARSITTRVLQQDELKAASVAKDKFFSLISHDLKSPISSNLSLINLINSKFDNYEKEDLRKFLSSMGKSLNTTYLLLEDLLLWSRVQKNKIDFAPEMTNLTDLMNDSLDLFDVRIRGKKLIIKKSYPLGFEAIVDKQMMSTIFRNLLSNATKFSNKEGLIEIDIHKNIAFNGDTIEINFIDFGVGIPKEKMSKLFDIGEDTSTPGTEDEKGTGLGLIICREFVEKHGGELTVSSELNQGTKVTLLLPQ